MQLNASQRKNLADLAVGVKVERATSVVRDKTLFKVVGRVLLTNLMGYVTTAMHGTPNATKIQHDGVGAVVDLCATLDLNACAQYSLLSITGAAAVPMTKALSAIRGMDIPVVLETGNINLVRAADVAGEVSWTVWYVPLEAGARIDMEPDA